MNTIQGSILQTHVFTGSIHEGLQWAIYNATLGVAHEYEGGRCECQTQIHHIPSRQEG